MTYVLAAVIYIIMGSGQPVQRDIFRAIPVFQSMEACVEYKDNDTGFNEAAADLQSKAIEFYGPNAVVALGCMEADKYEAEIDLPKP